MQRRSIVIRTRAKTRLCSVVRFLRVDLVARIRPNPFQIRPPPLVACPTSSALLLFPHRSGATPTLFSGCKFPLSTLQRRLAFATFSPSESVPTQRTDLPCQRAVPTFIHVDQLDPQGFLRTPRWFFLELRTIRRQS